MGWQGKPLAPEVEVAVLARRTPGFSGADLSNMVNEAALLAAKSNADVITPAMLDEARDKILMGSERRSAPAADTFPKCSTSSLL